MIAEKLRKAVLQAAIQGKLTEQLPEDGDARDLLKEIQQEKARLVKEGKLKKEKPLPPITEDEIPFDIPENWVWCRLGEMVTLISGTSYDKGSITSNGIRILRGGNIIDKKHVIAIDSNDVFVQERLFDEEKQVIENDIVIVGSTGSSTVIGKPAIVSSAIPDAQIGAFLRIVRPLYGRCIPYIHALFKSNYYRDHVSNSVQGTNIFNIRADIILEMLIPLPPLEEQKSIVKQLDIILAEIEKLETEEAKLEALEKAFPQQLKNAILQAAIQGKLTQQLPEDGDARGLLKQIRQEKSSLVKTGKLKKENPLPPITEDELPFDIPENWVWVRLGEVTDYGMSKQVLPKNIPENSWILELEDIDKDKFSINSMRTDRKPGSSKNQFEVKDVLYGKLRPYLHKVVVADFQGYCSTEIIPFKGYGALIAPNYLKYFMVAPSVDYYINQITHGMDMPRLGTNKARQLLVPLPPLAEQERIVERLEELLPLCEKLE